MRLLRIDENATAEDLAEAALHLMKRETALRRYQDNLENHATPDQDIVKMLRETTEAIDELRALWEQRRG